MPPPIFILFISAPYSTKRFTTALFPLKHILNIGGGITNSLRNSLFRKCLFNNREQ